MKIPIRYVLYFIVVFCYAQFGFAYILKADVVTQLEDAIILVLAVHVVYCRLKSGRFIYKRTIFDAFIIVFTLIFLVSGFFNKVPLMAAILSYKAYLLYVLFFVVLMQQSKALFLGRRLIALMLWCFIGQLPFVIMQISLAFLQGRLHDDTARGTFPGPNNLSYSVFAPLFFCTYMFLVEKRKCYRLPFWILLPVLVLPMGEYGIAAFFLFSSTVIVMRNVRSVAAFAKTIAIGGLLAILLLGFSYVKVNHSITSRPFTKTLSLAEWYQRLTIGQNDVRSGAQRNLYFPLTYMHLEKYAAHPLIGFGPGMYASYVAYRLMPETNYLVYNIFGQMELYGQDPGVDSQIIPIWGEFGYLGLGLFFFFLCYAILYFYHSYQSASYGYLKGLALTASVATIFLLVGFYVNHMWETQTIFLTVLLFWYAYIDELRISRNTGVGTVERKLSLQWI